MLRHEEKNDVIEQDDTCDDTYDAETDAYDDDAETDAYDDTYDDAETDAYEILDSFNLIKQQLEEIKYDTFQYSYEASTKSSYYFVEIMIHIRDILETTNITAEYFKAWHVNPDYPFINKLKILSTYFLEDVKPEIITITQQNSDGNEYICGLNHYLKHSLHSFIIDYFKEHDLFDSFENNLTNINNSLIRRKIINITGLRPTINIIEYIDRFIENKVVESDIINSIMEQKHDDTESDEIYVNIWTDNIFKEIIDFVRCKLTTCYHHCAICNNMIENPGIKMTSCSQDICKLGFIDIGAGFNIENIIMHEGQLLDLLLCLLYAYVSSGRSDDDLPNNISIDGFDEDINQTIILDSFIDKNNNFDKRKLLNLIDKIPSINYMQNIIITTDNETNIINVLNSIHPLIYKTIKWLYLTNMAYIRYLDEPEQDPNVQTQWQFQTICDNAEKEHKFNELRQETIENIRKYKSKSNTGSFNAYHGTGIYNGLPIIFHGLKNYSGTKMMSTGSALGSGIYTAEGISTAMNYARSDRGWENSMFGSTLTLIFLCEIIDRPSDFTNETNGYFGASNVYVIPNENYVITRRILINPTNRNANTSGMQVTGILEAEAVAQATSEETIIG